MTVASQVASNRRASVVDMLAKVPVNRGSLIKSIEDLLKTIETSENAIMIPTLLRDKCDFDACELLFVAKILKASILGHTDLVEFYVNHAGNKIEIEANSNGGQQSPQMSRLNSLSSPTTISSSATSHTESDNGLTFSNNGSTNKTSVNGNQESSLVNSLASSRSVSTDSNSSSVSGNHQANGNSSASLSWSSAVSGPNDLGQEQGLHQPEVAAEQQALLATLATRIPLQQRQAQPPSLLQLTTNNNHINSMAASLANQTLDQLLGQLAVIDRAITPSDSAGQLSISIANLNVQQQLKSPASTNGRLPVSSDQPKPSGRNNELRSSRSAGCLFRLNSPSSPRAATTVPTPTTPLQPLQAETLANGSVGGGPDKDLSAPVKLLLQIEQLKASISHVSHLLESVVQLYKESIDNIA